MRKRPLYLYVIAVAVVMAALLGVFWFSGDTARFHTSALVSAGFLLGMLAMYIAVHMYSWK